jgi:hypothetical protein
MDKREREAIERALIEWFRSQEIDPLDAAYVMACTIGGIIGLMSYRNPTARREAIDFLRNEMIKCTDVNE